MDRTKPIHHFLARYWELSCENLLYTSSSFHFWELQKMCSFSYPCACQLVSTILDEFIPLVVGGHFDWQIVISSASDGSLGKWRQAFISFQIERNFWKASQETCKMGSSVHNSLVVGTEGLRKKFQDKPIFALCPINFPIGNFYQEGRRGTMLLYKYFCQYYLTWLVLSLLQESSSFSSVLYLLSNLSNVGLSKWIRRDLKS